MDKTPYSDAAFGTNVNPFRSDLVINTFKKVSTASSSGGTVVRFTTFEVDDRINVYNKSFLAVYKNLPSAGKDMLVYLIDKLGYEKEYLELREDKYCAEMGVAPRTFRKARQSLMNLVIAKRESRANTYWVNPRLFFRGNRMEYFGGHVKNVGRLDSDEEMKTHAIEIFNSGDVS